MILGSWGALGRSLGRREWSRVATGGANGVAEKKPNGDSVSQVSTKKVCTYLIPHRTSDGRLSLATFLGLASDELLLNRC